MPGIIEENSWTCQAISKVFLHLFLPFRFLWSVTLVFIKVLLKLRGSLRSQTRAGVLHLISSLFFLIHHCDLYVELRCYLTEQTRMIHQLLDDFEKKLASFTSSALFLFKTSRFFFGENSTSATLSTSTRPFEIEKPHSTKYGVASFGMMCDVHVCNESCSVCERNRLLCCRSWPIAQHLYIPSPEGMKLPLTTTMAPRFATIDTS